MLFSFSASSLAVYNETPFYAADGTPAAIQAAVDEANAAGGGTVYIPAGTWYWNGETVTVPKGVSIIGEGIAGCMSYGSNWQDYTASTILHNNAVPTSSYKVPTMFQVIGNCDEANPTRIANIQFEATAPANYDAEWGAGQDGAAISLRGAYNFRIDHCTFISFCGSAIVSSSADWAGTPAPYSAYGLVDHCVVNVAYKPSSNPTESFMKGMGFWTQGNMADNDGTYIDEAAPFAGKYEAIPNVSLMYIEDCKFIKCRHSTDATNGGVVCARYNLIGEPAYYGTLSNAIGEFDQHGGWTPNAAGVLLEAYGNTILGKENFGTLAFYIRGGHGIIYDNTFNPPDFVHWGNILVKFARDNSLCPVTNTYIWGNDHSNCYFIDNNAGYVEGVDYFLRAPTQELDGWSYSPYPYPHYLVEGGDPPQPTPSPTQTPSTGSSPSDPATTPTATPYPTAYPTETEDGWTNALNAIRNVWNLIFGWWLWWW